jgi:hypothetical protein
MSESKKDLQRTWLDAIAKGTFVTDKHHPDSLSAGLKGYRSVVDDDALSVLPDFIKSGLYSVSAYQNYAIPNHPIYFVKPDPNTIDVSGSGVPSYAVTTNGIYDAFLVVHSKDKGPHIYAYSMIDTEDHVNKLEWGMVEVVK